MDADRFDSLVKGLAAGSSRRKVIKGVGGGAVAGILSAVGIRRGQAAADKVGICHRTGSATNPVVLITVSVNAIPAHKAHGDTINPDFSNDVKNCGGCDISCDDGDPCTIDTCVKGVCVHTPIVCNDNNPCTDDACVGGKCVFTPVVGRPCDDGNACTEKDACDATGACVGTTVNCDDGDACTKDSCDPASGCVHTVIDCDDGDACTKDSCDPAIGCVHTPISCDDGDPCTNDRCDPTFGCVNEPIVCTEPGQICLDGVCQGCLGTDCSGIVFGCEGDPGCNCFITVENNGFCHRNQPCAGLQSCASSADCPPGFACSLSTCCGPAQGQICIRPCAGTSLAGADFVGGPTTAGQ